MSRLRTWCGRGIIVVAAAASIATKRPSWSIEAKWPSGTPTSAPDDAHGVLVTIEATAPPHVQCARGPETRDLEPLPGTKDRFFCPGYVRTVTISGNASGGCGKPEPPSNQFVRITSTAIVPMWTVVAAQHAIGVTHDGEIGAGIAHAVVRSNHRAWVTASVDDTGARASVSGPHTDGTQYDIVVTMAATEDRTVTVSAEIHGPCDAEPCTAPADATLEVP